MTHQRTSAQIEESMEQVFQDIRMSGLPDTMEPFISYRSIMCGWNPPLGLLSRVGKKLTLEEAADIAEAYIDGWHSKQRLKRDKVIEFGNYFYSLAKEANTEYGAFEFLIDLESGYVVSEPGPNRIWNLKYSVELKPGIGFLRPTKAIKEMTISIKQAHDLAQTYLDKVLPGTRTNPKGVETFYGYYTLGMLDDDRIIGVLSVNGYTGQIWLHHWHGTFIAMLEPE